MAFGKFSAILGEDEKMIHEKNCSKFWIATEKIKKGYSQDPVKQTVEICNQRLFVSPRGCNGSRLSRGPKATGPAVRARIAGFIIPKHFSLGLADSQGLPRSIHPPWPEAPRKRTLVKQALTLWTSLDSYGSRAADSNPGPAVCWRGGGYEGWRDVCISKERYRGDWQDKQIPAAHGLVYRDLSGVAPPLPDCVTTPCRLSVLV